MGAGQRVGRIAISHSLFSLFANPVHYVWGMAALCLLLGLLSFVGAVIAKILGAVAAYLALLSVLLVVLGILLFVMGVVVKQGNMVQRELWILQRAQLSSGAGMLTTEQRAALANEVRPSPRGEAAETTR